ncbi:metalloprotease [Candidatus Woesearchaeota archaeon]|nr:metalloprotease [Candidatus Woesearchaeota archaeon]
MLMRFSKFELREIVKAWVVVSLVFGIATVGLNSKLLSVFPFMFLTAGVGFLFHELAHKFLAQRYGCWAEFRSNNGALLIGLLLSFVGFILLAPGGVFIHGASRSQHGKIAFSGPLMNVLVAVLFLVLYLFFASEVFVYGFRINSLLAAFILFPFPPFDGFSVWKWSRLAYVLIAVCALVLFVF